MSEATSFEPMSPVPPMTRIFMPEPPLARMNGDLASGRVPGPAAGWVATSSARRNASNSGRPVALARHSSPKARPLLQIRSSHRNQDLRFTTLRNRVPRRGRQGVRVHVRMMTSGRAALLLVAFLVSGCGPAARPPSAVAHFDVSGERFQVVVSDAATIDVLQRLARGEPAPSIPNGRLVRGSGNEPWHWRLEDVQMADATTEVCDGRPSYVEAHLDEFLAIGRYCPWTGASRLAGGALGSSVADA